MEVITVLTIGEVVRAKVTKTEVYGVYLTGEVIRPGETMTLSDRTRCRFVAPNPLPGNDDHYVVERLLVTDIEPTCDCCRLRPSEQN